MAGFAALLLHMLVRRSASGSESCGHGDGTGTCAAPLADTPPLSAGSRPRPQDLLVRTEPYENHGQRLYGGPHVHAAFLENGFARLTHDNDWDMLWTSHPMNTRLANRSLRAKGPRLVNHCDYFRGGGQKGRLARHLHRVQRAFGVDVDAGDTRPGYLRVFDLSNKSQHTAWLADCVRRPEKHWVLKAVSTGLSKNISIVQGYGARAAQPAVGWKVAQEYLSEPYMGLGNRKFHLRLYVLATRWSPPAAFLYNEGLLLRSRAEYDANSVSEERDVFSAVSASVEGLPLDVLWQHVGQDEAVAIWGRIRLLLQEVLGVAREESNGVFEELEPRRGYGCFDLYGADVMLDARLQPYILEFNTGPNLGIDRASWSVEQAALQRGLKTTLVAQISRWATQRLVLRPSTAPEAEAIEAAALRGFTPIFPAAGFAADRLAAEGSGDAPPGE